MCVCACVGFFARTDNERGPDKANCRTQVSFVSRLFLNSLQLWRTRRKGIIFNSWDTYEHSKAKKARLYNLVNLSRCGTARHYYCCGGCCQDAWGKLDGFMTASLPPSPIFQQERINVLLALSICFSPCGRLAGCNCCCSWWRFYNSCRSCSLLLFSLN